MTQFAAIPTVYKGVHMRSRLEARWAAFFDLCGWQWEYEPFDLNGWIPDFMLRGAKTNTLVEVKPLDWNVPTIRTEYTNRDGSTRWHERRDLDGYIKSFPDLTKIFGKSEHEVVVCGACLPDNNLASVSHGSAFGVFAVEDWNEVSVALLDYEVKTGKSDFLSCSGSYCHRISGERDGDHHIFSNWIDGVRHDTGHVALERWKQAGNAVQWKSPRKDPKPKLPKSKLLPVTSHDVAVAKVCGPLFKSFLQSLNEDEKRWSRQRYHKSHVVSTQLPEEMYSHPLFHDMNRALRTIAIFLHAIPACGGERRGRLSTPLAVLWEINPDTFKAIVSGAFYNDGDTRTASLSIQTQIANSGGYGTDRR